MDQPFILWGYDVKYLEFFVSLLGTVSTILIAVFAGRIAYIQSTGKRPYVIERSQRYDFSDAPPGHVLVSLRHQVWNRRAYSVRIDAPRIVFDNPVLLPAKEMGGKEVLMTARRVHVREPERIIRAGEMAEFTTAMWVKSSGLLDLNEAYLLRTNLYDPMVWKKKKTLLCQGALHPSKTFRQPIRSGIRRALSRIWFVGRFIERDDEWFNEGGRDAIPAKEIFEGLKNFPAKSQHNK